MMKFSHLSTLALLTLCLIVTMIIAESSQEERQLTMCKKIEVKLRKDKSQVTEVNVCKYNQDQYYINPVCVVMLSEHRKINYHVFSKKYYTNLRMLVSSNYILEQIAGKPEYHGRTVMFAKATQVSFMNANQFHHVRKDVQIDDRWKTLNYSEESDEIFADMEISTDSLNSMSDFLAELSNIIATTEKSIELKSVIAEFEIPEYNEYIGTIRQSVEVQNLGPTILGLIDMLDAKNNQPSIMTIVSGLSGVYAKFPKLLENGWYLAQRRDTPGVDFNRTWNDYRNGFGNPNSDFWMGLERLRDLTEGGKYRLRLEFETHRGVQMSGEYKHFQIGSESTKYKLNISGFDYKSSAGHDYMDWSNGYAFATVDRDTQYSCAKALGGGWWMNPKANHHCVSVHFNNELRSSFSYSQTCAHYYYIRGDYYHKHRNECLKRTRMFLIY